MTFKEWIQASENLLMQDYCLTLADAGFDQSDLEQSWSGGETPTEYVTRMALKFDLTSKTEVWLS